VYVAAVKLTAFFNHHEYPVLVVTTVEWRLDRPERAWRRRDAGRTVEVAVPQRYR
jgi:hypothetical protein